MPQDRRCPKCDAPISANARFCRNCGEKIDFAAVTAGMIYCPKCKKTVARGKFCIECGYSFRKTQQTDVGRKKRLVVIIAAAAVLAVCIGAGALFALRKEPEERQRSASVAELKTDEVQIGDTITFGSYEQDNDTSNGTEAIEWQVLDKQDGRVLVISKYGLDYQQYHGEYESVTWEECDLRRWLNDDFMDSAFTSEEQAKIPEVTVENKDNPDYGTDGGNDTQDKVFLLSIDEAEEYFDTDEERQCEPTEYAMANDAYVNSDNGNCWWWLRSPGLYQNCASDVSSNGGVNYSGDFVSNVGVSVRPALWINLES